LLIPRELLAVVSFVVACGSPGDPMHPEPTAVAPPQSYELPGASGPVTVDYIGYEPAPPRVWVPVGDTGSVDVFDVQKATFTRIDGFKTVEREAHGKKRMMGPSSVSFGPHVAFVGNRATSEVCVVDRASLQLGACVALPSPPDGIAYVSSASELWVTTPKDQSITVLDATNEQNLQPKLVIKTEGAPEGYAVDDARGFFFTNLEDKNRTLAIDIKAHSVKSSWPLECANGPRGIAADHTRRIVYVACTNGVVVLDAEHGTTRRPLDTGDGVDNIDYQDSTSRLYVAAGKAGRLTVAHVDETGTPFVLSATATAPGARNAVVDSKGTAYLVDPSAARLLVVPVP
jgi:hypothetical protein